MAGPRTTTRTIRLVALTMLVLALAAVAPGSARQRQASMGGVWTHPRTPWGDPDLDGVWTSDNNFSVPLERPAQVSDKVLLEGEDLENALRARSRMIAAVADGGAVGAGPSHWYENLTARSRRSSLIIDLRTDDCRHRRPKRASAPPPRPRRDVAAGRPTRGRISASGIAASPSACRA
jgi:hypothetical protein